MKLRIFYMFVIFGLTLMPLYAAVGETPKEVDLPNAWISVADGIDYQKFHLTNPRPINIYVTRMDKKNSNTTIETSIAKGMIASGTESNYGIETVRKMANRYDQAINYWGQSWGSRNNVAVAINGYFFNNDLPEWWDGTPWSGVINSGWYAKRFSNYDVPDAGFAWSLNRTTHIGDCVGHKASKNFVYFVRAEYDANIKEVNVPFSGEELILYTSQYDSTTRTATIDDIPRVEILIEMERPTMILPSPAYAKGYIRSMRENQGSTAIPFDHVVLSAWGEVGNTIMSRVIGGTIAVGDEVRISQEIEDCASTTVKNWTKTYASLGGDYHFLNSGVIRTNYNNPDAYVPNSRTAIAYNDNYVYFIVVDRCSTGKSEGIKIIELGNFVKDTLQGTDAVTVDSGGSSTMVVNDEIVNDTDSNFTLCPIPSEVSDSIEQNAVVLEKDSERILFNQYDNLYAVQSVDSPSKKEALVGTGLLMVVVENKEQSTSFEPGEIVKVLNSTEVRLGPGTNYTSIGSISEGMTGVVQDPLNKLNGVWAKSSPILYPDLYNSHWWKIDFGNLSGWVKEDALNGWIDMGGIKTYLPHIIR